MEVHVLIAKKIISKMVVDVLHAVKSFQDANNVRTKIDASNVNKDM